LGQIAVRGEGGEVRSGYRAALRLGRFVLSSEAKEKGKEDRLYRCQAKVLEFNGFLVEHGGALSLRLDMTRGQFWSWDNVQIHNTGSADVVTITMVGERTEERR